MAFGIGKIGPIQQARLQGCRQQGLQVAAALEHLHQVDAVGEGPVGRPHRHPVGQGQIPHRWAPTQLPLRWPADVLHRADPGLVDGGQGIPAKPLGIKASVVGQHRIGSRHQGLEMLQAGPPGLGQAGHGRRDAIDGLSRIGLGGQQEGNLGQHRPLGHLKQHGPHLDALGRGWFQARCLGVENQQGCW